LALLQNLFIIQSAIPSFVPDIENIKQFYPQRVRRSTESLSNYALFVSLGM